MAFDNKNQFNIDSVEPFLKHLEENGFSSPEAELDDLQLLAGGNSRSTLKLDTNVGSFICHVQHKPHMMKLEQEIDFQNFLGENGVNVAPHVGKAGNYDDNHQFEMTEFVENHPTTDPSLKHIKNVGSKLAKFHEVGKLFVEDKEVTERELSIAENMLESVESAIQRASALATQIKNVALTIAENPSMSVVYAEKTITSIASRLDKFEMGMLHGDVHKENILFDKDGEVIALIDFESARFAPLIRDVSTAMRNFACNHSASDPLSYKKFSPEKAKTFLESYNEERTLTPKELKYIDNFFKSDKHRTSEENGFSKDDSKQLDIDVSKITHDIALQNLKHSNKTEISGNSR